MPMLSVKTPDEAIEIVRKNFSRVMDTQRVGITDALGRVLAEDITSAEYVPGFNRSSVDGYAVLSSDTFGCSESIPAILHVSGDVLMGQPFAGELTAGSCISVPTGGEVPPVADSVVMVEHTEDFCDGTVGIIKPSAPGNNMIFKGDDVKPGDIVLKSGGVITAHDIGALAALGIIAVNVRKKPVVGIISTGDELISADMTPTGGQIRDVNSYLLAAAMISAGAAPEMYGIVSDDDTALDAAVAQALDTCDVVLISGGSSVGEKDATARIIEGRGEILLHGIAMKPGKPTIIGKFDGKPIVGLPGHPVAAFFVARLFVALMLDILMGVADEHPAVVHAEITEEISANHGRAEYVAVKLRQNGDVTYAEPVRSKSGLITSLPGTDGYICIPRDCEGLAKNAAVKVTLWR
jgi:molybdopterin molybdotransferase